MRAIKRLILIAFFSIIYKGLAFAKYEESSIGDWKFVQLTQDNHSKYCYIYSEPERSRATAIDHEGRYIVIVNNGGYATLGVSSNFDLDERKGFVLSANNRDHLLNVTSLSQAQTFTSIQDVAVINDLIQDEDLIRVRSYSVDDKTALDYYSMNGFTNALKKLMDCDK